jgi:hypothetical protein
MFIECGQELAQFAISTRIVWRRLWNLHDGTAA